MFGGPRQVQVNLVNRCNHGCVFCYNHSPDVAIPDSNWLRQVFPLELFEGLPSARGPSGPTRSLFRARASRCCIRTSKKMVRAVKEQGLSLSIQTTCWPCDSAAWLCDARVDRLLVNVSAATESSWRRTHPFRHCDDFERLKSLLSQISGTPFSVRARPAIEVTYIIHSENYEEIDEAVRLAAQVGAERCLLQAGRSDGRSSAPAAQRAPATGLRPSIERARTLASQLKLEANFPNVAFHLEQVRANGDFSDSLYAQEPGCYVGWYFLKVEIDGSVHFCCKDKPLGLLSRGQLAARRLGIRSRYEEVAAGSERIRRLEPHRCHPMLSAAAAPTSPSAWSCRGGSGRHNVSEFRPCRRPDALERSGEPLEVGRMAARDGRAMTSGQAYG